MQKIRDYLFLIAPFLLILGPSLYFRSFPINFPQLKEQAKNIVEQNIQQRIMQDIYQKFAQFFTPAKDQILKSRLA